MPGKYTGVVIFDRWDGCILFSGVYLMYVSEVAKEDLRPYAGQAIEIDALDVFQPINPGDGMIRQLRIVGPAQGQRPWAPVDGLALTAEKTSTDEPPSVRIEIRNKGGEPIRVVSSEIGLALMMKKQGSERGALRHVSDGPSIAAITRANVLNYSRWKHGLLVDGAMRYWSYALDNPLPEFFSLKPGESTSRIITFNVPP
ncbi:MAG: hypothetical protein ACREA0_25770, partial [bacterium]